MEFMNAFIMYKAFKKYSAWNIYSYNYFEEFAQSHSTFSCILTEKERKRKWREGRKEGGRNQTTCALLGHCFKDIFLPKQGKQMTKSGPKNNGNWSNFQFPAGFPIVFPCENLAGNIRNLHSLPFSLPLSPSNRQVSGCCWVGEGARDCETNWRTVTN